MEPTVVCKICGDERPKFATSEGWRPLGGVFALEQRRSAFRFCNDREPCKRDAERLMGAER